MRISIPLKIGEKYHDFCIDDARWHLDRYEEALIASKNDPKKYYDESLDSTTCLAETLCMIKKKKDPSFVTMMLIAPEPTFL